MTSRPVSTPRLVWAMVKAARQRWTNRVFGQIIAAFSRKRKAGIRRATAPKPALLEAVQAILAAVMFFGAFLMVISVVGRMTVSVRTRDADGRLAVPPTFYYLLRAREAMGALTAVARQLPNLTTGQLRQRLRDFEAGYPSSRPGGMAHIEGDRDDSPARAIARAPSGAVDDTKPTDSIERETFPSQTRPAENSGSREPAAGSREEGGIRSRPAAGHGLPGTEPAAAKPSVKEQRRRIANAMGLEFADAARDVSGFFGDIDQTEMRLHKAYINRGLDAFSPTGFSADMPGPRIWNDPFMGPRIGRALGLILTALIFMLLFRSFAAANIDLTDPSWSLEWFFTFPVRASAIFAARLLQVTLLNAFAWMTIFPLMGVILYVAGWGLWAILLATLTTLSVSAVVAGVQVVGETWLRRRLSRARLSNIVGLCTILQMLLLVTIMALVATPAATQWLIALAGRMPSGFEWLPTALPIGLCRTGPLGTIAIAAMLGVLVAVPLASAWIAQRMVAGGLNDQAASFLGRRRGPAAQAATSQLLRGFLGKELMLLARDRTFLAQAIILPVILCVFQVLLNPALAQAASHDLQHAAAVAFLTGAYVVLMSGSRLLIGELKGMWLLYTLPHRLEKLLFRKISLWSALGAIFAAAVWAMLAGQQQHIHALDVFRAGLAIGGVAIYGFISAGLSALGTDAAADRPRVGATIIYLNMLVGGTYAMAIYATTIWQSMVMVVLFVLVAWAIWQKVRERLPYLLDPTQLPPPALAISDAMVTVLAFVSAQGVCWLTLRNSGWPTAAIMTISTIAAGTIIVPASMMILSYRNIPHLLATLGLWRPRQAARQPSWLAAVARGAGLGALAAIAAAAYLWGVSHLNWAQQAMQDSALPEITRHGGYFWTVMLAVLAAPVIEEYLFRGLLFQAMMRNLRPAWAGVASAAVFAAIHPPIAFPAVFLLGLVAAWTMRRTGLLVSAIAAHMAYNGMLTLGPLLLQMFVQTPGQ